MPAKRDAKRAPKQKPSASPDLGLTDEQLDDLVEEATTDANSEEEQATGFFTMLENDLDLPFETEVLGVTVKVEALDLKGDTEIVAVCRAGNKRQKILISDLPLPDPPPQGAQWIAAYRRWRRWAD